MLLIYHVIDTMDTGWMLKSVALSEFVSRFEEVVGCSVLRFDWKPRMRKLQQAMLFGPPLFKNFFFLRLCALFLIKSNTLAKCVCP